MTKQRMRGRIGNYVLCPRISQARGFTLLEVAVALSIALAAVGYVHHASALARAATLREHFFEQGARFLHHHFETAASQAVEEQRALEGPLPGAGPWGRYRIAPAPAPEIEGLIRLEVTLWPPSGTPASEAYSFTTYRSGLLRTVQLDEEDSEAAR